MDVTPQPMQSLVAFADIFTSLSLATPNSVEDSSHLHFSLKIRNIVDSLASFVDAIPASHHLDVVLEGFSVEFPPLVFIVENKLGSMNLDEVEILLLAHELSFGQVKKIYTTYLISLNLTHASPTPANSEDVQFTSVESSSTKPSNPHMDQDVL
ncbi:unnamed protein product [Vicia faba]|uniref:Uncharacterized protein n=1 Tax=Vicia faba TaxID=3906 RepID=A0AAV0YTC6_VICFA|nr:unnamed protein product [Vicia faba]